MEEKNELEFDWQDGEGRLQVFSNGLSCVEVIGILEIIQKQLIEEQEASLK